MLLILGALVTLTALVVLPRWLGTPGGGRAPNLGYMSDQWLAQHRSNWDSQ
jgi:hypothetical protein